MATLASLAAARLTFGIIAAHGWKIEWTGDKAVPNDAWPIDIIANAIDDAVMTERRLAQATEKK